MFWFPYKIFKVLCFICRNIYEISNETIKRNDYYDAGRMSLCGMRQ